MISEKNKAKLNLLSTEDVAKILKLNVQVVTRKLQYKEIEGYKLGKDWRVSEEQLIEYLENNSNKKPKASEKDRVLQTYFEGNKLKSIPSSRKKRNYILEFLVSKLEYNRVYPEKELNAFLKEYHDDVCTLRREFIMTKLMTRKNGNYKVISFKAEN